MEFIIDKNQHFSLITDEKDWVENMKVKKSPTNESYFKYMKESPL